MESAIGAVKYQGDPLFLCEDVDLLACEYGWIWVLYYAPDPGQAATHFALVHADGKQLLDSIAKPLLKQVSGKEYPFFNLIYMESLPVATPDEQAAQNVIFIILKTILIDVLQFIWLF